MSQYSLPVTVRGSHYGYESDEVRLEIGEDHSLHCASDDIAARYSHTPITSRNLVNMAADVVKALGHTPTPLVKCTHCGQWAAVFTACRYCGAPVDPQD